MYVSYRLPNYFHAHFFLFDTLSVQMLAVLDVLLC